MLFLQLFTNFNVCKGQFLVHRCNELFLSSLLCWLQLDECFKPLTELPLFMSCECWNVATYCGVLVLDAISRYLLAAEAFARWQKTNQFLSKMLFSNCKCVFLKASKVKTSCLQLNIFYQGVTIKML